MSAVITGTGLITPLAATAAGNWQALLAGQSVEDHARVEGVYRPSRIGRLARVAADEALKQAGWSDDVAGATTTAIVTGTGKGDIEGMLAGSESGELPHPFSIFHFPVYAHHTGPRVTLSGACASGLHALIHAILLLQSGQAERALVIAAEACVHPLFIASFRHLRVLADDGCGCRPFDLNRKGFVMSEAAAAICLEAPDRAVAPEVVRIEGFGLGGDGHHLTGGDRQAAVLGRLIQQVVRDNPVDLVHAHGTGTAYNDAAEVLALNTVLRQCDNGPVLYSHKGGIGHSLGASGLVSVVISALCHTHDTVPGNVRTINPMSLGLLTLGRRPVHRRIGRSLVLAAGFGGAMAAVTLRSA